LKRDQLLQLDCFSSRNRKNWSSKSTNFSPSSEATVLLVLKHDISMSREKKPNQPSTQINLIIYPTIHSDQSTNQPIQHPLKTTNQSIVHTSR